MSPNLHWLPAANALAGSEAARHRVAALQTWLTNAALPIWLTRGIDWRRGGYFEKIGLDGFALDEPRRARVVARQIYVFATAQRMGWHSRAREATTHGLHFLLERMRLREGSYAAVVQPDGRVVRAEFDLYEHAFVLFALAAAHRAGHGNGALDEQAAALLDVMCARWRHPTAGFEEASPRRLPLLANPHMHLLEACLAWIDAGSAVAPRWEVLADELAELCLLHLVDPITGAVREHFDGDWRASPDIVGQVVEPGHQFEWAWLLLRWGQLRGRPEAGVAAMRLVNLGELHGVDAARGVAVNALRGDFIPLDMAAKLWPQTERLKVWCSLAASTTAPTPEDAMLLQHVVQAADGLFQYLRPSDTGLWREVMLPDGGFVQEPCRASSLYHLVCAIDSTWPLTERLERTASAPSASAPREQVPYQGCVHDRRR